MEPTSAEQYAAFESKAAPGLEQVRDDVWAVGLQLAGPYQPHYSLSYILRDADGDLHVVDTGMDYRDNWDRLVAALDQVGGGLSRVRTITATHSHPDHTALVGRVQEAGAEFILHRLEQEEVDADHAFNPTRIIGKLREWGAPEERIEQIWAQVKGMGSREHMPLLRADLVVDDGDQLPIPGFQLDVSHAPGHTPGHLILTDTARDLVFTGDHLLPNQFPAIGTGGDVDGHNPYGGYLEALDRLPADSEALPGHGFRFRGVGARAQQTIEHHLRRTREVLVALERNPRATVWEIASQLSWTAGWENLSGYYLYSAVRQTDMHRDYVASGAVIPPAA